MHLHAATGRWSAALAPSTTTADVSTRGRSVSTDPVTRRDRPTPDAAGHCPKGMELAPNPRYTGGS